MESIEINKKYREGKKQKKIIIGGIKIQSYIYDFYMSRGLNTGSPLNCRLCGKKATDIHHINNSYRGQRKHNEDGTDLIQLCRECHTNTHNNNTRETKQHLLKIAKDDCDAVKNRNGGKKET